MNTYYQTNVLGGFKLMSQYLPETNKVFQRAAERVELYSAKGKLSDKTINKLITFIYGYRLAMESDYDGNAYMKTRTEDGRIVDTDTKQRDWFLDSFPSELQ